MFPVMNRRFLAVLGLSAILALVVSAIFYQITVSVRSPGPKVETRSIVVATNPLPLGAVIKSSDLKIVQWPAKNIPPGAFSRIEEVVDRVAVSNILVEEPILDGRLAPPGSGVGLSGVVPPGMRAVSVRVNDVISVAGFVLPGSRVDVMVTATPRGGDGQAGPVTRTVLSNIQVVSAGRNMQPDGKGQPENVAVITLLVTPEQAEILTLAASEGRIQLALRNNTDKEQIASSGIHAAEIFTGRRRPVEPAKPPVVRRAAVSLPAPPPPAAPPPPPPPPRIELIRGDKRVSEVIAAANANDR
jgi:pilus assembly protein CpaB